MSDGEQPLVEEAGVDEEAPASIEFTFPTLTKKKVAVVGFATGSAHKAPFGDDAVEKWGINQLWKLLPDRKWDR